MELHASETGSGSPVLLLHGRSMEYADLASDVADTMDGLGSGAATFIGHSLGGKTAMEFALSRPERVDRLVVLDIAPVIYARHHDAEFEALLELDLAAIRSRRRADAALAAQIPNEDVRQFLLKDLRRTNAGFEWRLPLATIAAQYPSIATFVSELPRSLRLCSRSCRPRGRER